MVRPIRRWMRITGSASGNLHSPAHELLNEHLFRARDHEGCFRSDRFLDDCSDMLDVVRRVCELRSIIITKVCITPCFRNPTPFLRHFLS